MFFWTISTKLLRWWLCWKCLLKVLCSFPVISPHLEVDSAHFLAGRNNLVFVVVAVVVPSHHRHLWALFFACLANLFLFVFYLRKINRAASLCVVLCVFFFDFPHTAMTISPTLFLSNGHRAMYVAGRSPFFFSSSSFFCSPTRENHLIWSVTTRWPTHRLRLCRKNKKRQQYGQAVEAFFFTTSNRIRQQFADLGRTWMALIRLRIH